MDGIERVEVAGTVTSKRIRVLLVEDHALVRQGTKALIEQDPSIEVVGEADSAEDALRLAGQLSPDVVLLDVRLRSGSGIDVARTLQRQRSPVRVLVVTAYDFEQYVTALTRAGVSGYVLKDIPPNELIRAIHQVREGQGVLPGKIAATVLDGLYSGRRERQRSPDALTVREIEVLELVMEGYGNSSIAQRLGISTRTVEAHTAHILGKLGAASRSEAVQIAVARGYLKPQQV